MSQRSICLLFLVAMLLLSSRPAEAQLRAQETDIPVRDGKTLKADVYVNPGSRPKPVILIQTPYNKATYRLTFSLYRSLVLPLDSSRYQYVVVDWRGFHASKDAEVAGYDRGLDGHDIVEWVAAQPWCNGKVATYGGSALGQIQFQTARHHPPHLVCAMPMIKDYKTKYSDYYYGGALRCEHVESLQGLGFTTVGVITARPVENAIWDFIAQQNDYPEDIAVPMLLVSGWFDHYPGDVIRAFEDLRDRSASPVRGQHRLIMGPWTHSGVDLETQGELRFPNATSVARDAALAFFDYHLNGAKNGWPLTPTVRYYQMGEDEWRDCERWSELGAQEHTLFLAGDGRLLPAPDDGADESDVFLTDPRDPSPSHGGARFNPFDPGVVAGPVDIRDVVESRGDVLLYTSDPLTEDLRVNGGGTVSLHVRCDRPDADYTFRLCDVHPDGRSIILTDGVHRARFREGTDREVPLQPGAIATVRIRIDELAHTFRKGHRVRLVIGGADFPRFDINLHNGAEMYVAGDTLVAESEVLHSLAHPSSLTLETEGSGTAALPLPTHGDLRIEHAWPQPLTDGGSMRISIRVETGRQVRLAVRDMLGRTVRVLHDGFVDRGSFSWDGRDRAGNPLPSGTYLLTLEANGLRDANGLQDANGWQDLLPVTVLR